MSSRRQVRERVMQALYALELGGDEVQHVIDTVLLLNLEDAAISKFAEKLFLRTLDNRDAADEIVHSHTENWEVSRIALVDRLVLRIAITEIMHFEDIPPKVSINEAIEVAKKFSTLKSGKFVNGILDAVTLYLFRDGKLNKTGRGLVGMESLQDRTTKA